MGYIQFEDVHKSFGNNEVLKGITMGVEKGHMATLLGPSGCGKSTLLRCLAGLEEVTSGKVYVDGKDITDVTPRNRNIGMVFQQYSLFPNMSVYQNVAFGLNMQKSPKDEVERKVKEMLRVVGLEEKIDQYPAQLSGGQQQRVALARAIVTGPKVLLLDEPLSAIDAKLRHSLQIEIRRIQKEFNMTTIFVTHDQDEAMVMSDEIHLFHDGRIEQSGTPTEMYTAPKTRFAAGVIGSYNIFTAAEFKKLCGEDADAPDVAIRPEVVRLNYETSAPAPRYYAKGTIVNSLSHGNLVRYTVRCHDIDINSDVMFEKHSLLEVGEEVEVSIRKTNVIMLY